MAEDTQNETWNLEPRNYLNGDNSAISIPIASPQSVRTLPSEWCPKDCPRKVIP